MGMMGSSEYKKPNYALMICSDIKNGNPIKMSDNSKYVIDKKNKDVIKFMNFVDEYAKGRKTSEQFLKFIKGGTNRYVPILFTDGKNSEVKSFMWKEIEKTQYSTGQTMSRAELTELSENGVALVLAALVHGKIDKILDEKEMLSLSGNLDLGKGKTTDSIKKVVDFLINNPDWEQSCLKSAEAIKKKCSNIGTSHTYHRDSVFMNSIYDEFNRLKKKAGQVFKSLSFNNDKWNPADIWITKLEGSARSKLTSSSDLPSYNLKLIESFEKTETIGVSLKKLGSVATAKVYNKDAGDVLSFSNVSFRKPDKKENIFKSKDVYLTAQTTDSKKENVTIQIRSFATRGEDVQAEIKGETASHGKVGFGNILSLFDISNMAKPTIQKSVIVEKSIQGSPQNLSDYCKQIAEMATNVYGISYSQKDVWESYEKQQYKSYEAKIGAMSSKFQALSIANAIKSLKVSEMDTVVTFLILYASSSMNIKGSFESSIFLKVQ